ncbi:MAG TPA: IS21 family transposase, partial [Thermotogota bacterium]|nr:IS21 family transposase [Thermotogota bacterium]
MLGKKERNQIHVLKDIGYSHVAIAQTLGIHPNTVTKILKQEENQMPKKSSLLDPFVGYLQQRLEKYPRLSSVVLLEELRAQGFLGQISILRELVRKLRPPKTLPCTERYETEPGEQFQVDFGQGKCVIGGEVQVVRFFCMVLGYSRLIFVRPVPNEKLATLVQSHNQAFEYFGGYPRKGLYDNMKTVVNLLESKKTFNTKFMDFADFYGFSVQTHRAYHPQTKGKVERIVPYYRSHCLYGKEYTHWEQLEEATLHWMEKTSKRLHSGLKEIPLQRFLQVEKDQLLPLVRLYPVRRLETRKVTSEGKVVYQNRMVDVGTQYAGSIVNLEQQGASLHIYQQDQPISNTFLGNL